jgi:molybdopterin molybdotransferase
MRTLLDFDEARRRILALTRPPSFERVSVSCAAGRFLAEDIVTSDAVPAFDHSTMDGYAVRWSEASERLPVVGESRAGGTVAPHGPKTACRIFTGARIPQGADTVVMQEDAVIEAGAVAFKAPLPTAGSNVRRRGSDLAAGALALGKGQRLGARHIALLHAFDRPWVNVGARPVVTIVSTGDELRLPGEPGREGQIPESLGHALGVLLQANGATVRLAPIVGDDGAAIDRALSDSAARSDLVLTVGGASVGDYDLVGAALGRTGVTLDFWKVAMRPGKPLLVGQKGPCLFLGLPGNPASALVTATLFALPLVRALSGATRPFELWHSIPLSREIERTGGRTEFARATIDEGPNGATVTLVPWQASGSVLGMARADALVRIEASATFLPAGSPVPSLLLDSQGL